MSVSLNSLNPQNSVKEGKFLLLCVMIRRALEYCCDKYIHHNNTQGEDKMMIDVGY